MGLINNVPLRLSLKKFFFLSMVLSTVLFLGNCQKGSTAKKLPILQTPVQVLPPQLVQPAYL